MYLRFLFPASTKSKRFNLNCIIFYNIASFFSVKNAKLRFGCDQNSLAPNVAVCRYCGLLVGGEIF